MCLAARSVSVASCADTFVADHAMGVQPAPLAPALVQPSVCTATASTPAQTCVRLVLSHAPGTASIRSVLLSTQGNQVLSDLSNLCESVCNTASIRCVAFGNLLQVKGCLSFPAKQSA